MQRYSKHAPTGFDAPGAFLPDQQDWFVAPVSQTRDSGELDRSNFQAFLDALGGESDTVEVHRFGHWGPGWYEIILIDPTDTERVAIAERMEEALADYPVLDDEDFSRREWEAYLDGWERYGASDFVCALRKEFNLRDCIVDTLVDADRDVLRTFYESLIPSGEYYNGDDVSLNASYAVDSCTRQQLAQFVRTLRNPVQSA